MKGEKAREKIDEKIDELMKRFHDECEDIAAECVEEGYPSHGENYDLRCQQLWKDCYKSEMDDLENMENMENEYWVIDENER